ncbi:MAG: pilus (MSHA type) biogenesis protein MshL [Saccharospirillaceae bacterium]|nr:pilus (MSHA type) biogenesis protein MshL [Saccharospirillaceae bacterium]MCD8530579.1 pilus (MSHA type) biogenesis protein MshL [Saccharospirillaceae bacterium]
MTVVIFRCAAPFQLKRLLSFFLVVLLSGCATLSPQTEKESDEPLLQAAADPVQPGLDLQQLLPPLDQQPLAPAEHFDVVADSTPATAFFNSLVDGTGYNLVVHPEVSGEITLNLKKVTLLETLQAVRDIYGFDFVQSAYGIQILPRRQQTRIFPINYLNVKRSGRSGMHVSSGQVTSTDSRQSSTQTNTTTSGSSSQTINSSEVGTESNTDFWQGLKGTLQLMLSQEGDAQVVVDAHAGIVVVKALPGTLNHIARYLEKAELSVQKQVLIEAKIIEVTLSDGFQSGIDWGAFGKQGSRYTYDATQSATALTNPDLIDGIFSLNITATDFTAALQLLQTQGEVKVLSSPRIATVNNQKAVIKVGSDEFFVTNVSNTTTSTTTGSANTPDIELTPFFSGIALDVTPQIGSDQEVILHVHPTVTEVEEKVKTVQLNNDDYTLPLAYSTVRETDSIVRARSGQVVVIGGLMQNRKVRTDASVPWLGNIPLLGWFFRQTREDIVQSELVILIQPRVVDSALTPEQIDELNQRYSRLMPARR